MIPLMLVFGSIFNFHVGIWFTTAGSKIKIHPYIDGIAIFHWLMYCLYIATTDFDYAFKRRHIDCVVVYSFARHQKQTHHPKYYTFEYATFTVNCEIKQWRKKTENGTELENMYVQSAECRVYNIYLTLTKK